MKGVIAMQAHAIAQLTAEMKIMKEQLSVITDRLTGPEPTRAPTPVATPPSAEIEDAVDEDNFPQLPVLPHGSQPRMPTRKKAPALQLAPGEEPNWAKIVEHGRKTTRTEAGDAYIQRIAAVKKKLETIRAKSARRTARQRTLREYVVSYFSGRGRIQHWQMKKLIREALFSSVSLAALLWMY